MFRTLYVSIAHSSKIFRNSRLDLFPIDEKGAGLLIAKTVKKFAETGARVMVDKITEKYRLGETFYEYPACLSGELQNCKHDKGNCGFYFDITGAFRRDFASAKAASSRSRCSV